MSDRASTPDAAIALVANGSMRARRHPVVVLMVWAWTAVFGLAMAWPFARYVAGAYGAHPRGDGPLFDPGALALYDLVHHARDATPALFGHLVVVLPVALLGGLFPLAALLVAVAHTTRDRTNLRASALLRRATRSVPSLLFLLLLATIAEGLLVGLAVGAGSLVTSSLAGSAGEARADQAGFVVGAVLMILVAAVGVMHDLARAAVVRFRVSALRASVLGWKTLRRHPVANVFSWGWRALAALVPVVLGSMAAEKLGGRTGGALVGLFVIHQAVIGARVALRASWLARAMRSVDAAHHVARVSSPPSVEAT